MVGIKMIWYYYIPHLWEEERVVWEDVYLMADINPEHKQLWIDIDKGLPSLWLTVDGLASEEFHDQDDEFLDETEKEDLEHCGVVIRLDTGDMIVNTQDFNKKELLEWAKLYLQVRGHTVNEMKEGTYRMFQGSNPHAVAIEEAIKIKKEFEEQDET
jgi:hypothetical protein